jgi:hypothetical protein
VCNYFGYLYFYYLKKKDKINLKGLIGFLVGLGLFAKLPSPHRKQKTNLQKHTFSCVRRK